MSFVLVLYFYNSSLLNFNESNPGNFQSSMLSFPANERFLVGIKLSGSIA